MNLRGVLTLQGITMSDKTVSIDLDDLRPSTKYGYYYVDGFLTMGDNPVTNCYFDQAAGIANCPIAEDAILGVAVDYRD